MTCKFTKSGDCERLENRGCFRCAVLLEKRETRGKFIIGDVVRSRGPVTLHKLTSPTELPKGIATHGLVAKDGGTVTMQYLTDKEAQECELV